MPPDPRSLARLSRAETVDGLEGGASTEVERTMQRTLIHDRYVLLEPLGQGGMAEVYLARDEVLGREVALKLLADRYAGREEVVERFKLEARNAASLTHPNIVATYDGGRTAEGAYYIAMEYVPGGTLGEYIARRGVLDGHTAATVARQITQALGTAHERGVVHRDVKPQNVLVTSSGDVKVADFGIARAISQGETKTSLIRGTASYMSPEQAAGRPAVPASDLYSVGVILYEMLTGSPPFRAETPIATAVKHVNEPVSPPTRANPAVSETMSAIVMRLLAKNPEDRYVDAGELIEDIERVERVRDSLLPLAAGRAGPLGAAEAIGTLSMPPVHASPGVGEKPRDHPASEARIPGLRRGARGRRRWSRRLLPAALLAALSVTVVLAALAWNVSWSLDEIYGPASVARNPGESAPGEASASPDPAPSAARDTGSSESVFVHRATPENISANSTYLDEPLANGNPDAVVSATQNWNPGGRSGTYNDHAIGVWYDADAGKWAIFNQDRQAMPEGTAFNVVVRESAKETG